MQRGGALTKHSVLSKISSIGFELESGQVSPMVHDTDKLIKPITAELPIPTETSDINFVQSYDTMTIGYCSRLCELDEYVKTLQSQIIDIGEYKLYNSSYQSTASTDRPIQYLVHTEFIMTFTLPPVSDNILLSHFLYMLLQVKELLDRPHRIYHHDQISIVDYGPGKYGYIIPNLIDDILTTKWVPQCTIKLSVKNVPMVIDYIAVEGNYKNNVTEHYQRLLIELQIIRRSEPSNMDRGFLYLAAMYLANSTKTAPITIRHPWAEIAHYWDNIKLVPSLQRDMEFINVKQFPVVQHIDDGEKDVTVMLELRTFNPQLSALIGHKSLTIKNMIEGITRHLGGRIPDKDHPVLGTKLMLDELLGD